MKTILIVDDSKEIRELVKVTLGPENYVVVEAGTGEDGVTVARKCNPDLVIMDVKMPGKINGFQAVGKIRTIKGLEEIPVIVLSGSGEAVQVQSDTARSGLIYFRKPFSPLDLIEKIDEILGNAA